MPTKLVKPSGMANGEVIATSNKPFKQSKHVLLAVVPGKISAACKKVRHTATRCNMASCSCSCHRVVYTSQRGPK